MLASDAFFPFADGPEAAIEAGVKAIIQPGGSKRDPEVIEACDAAGVAMVFTGRRHFRALGPQRCAAPLGARRSRKTPFPGMSSCLTRRLQRLGAGRKSRCHTRVRSLHNNRVAGKSMDRRQGENARALFIVLRLRGRDSVRRAFVTLALCLSPHS